MRIDQPVSLSNKYEIKFIHYDTSSLNRAWLFVFILFSFNCVGVLVFHPPRKVLRNNEQFQQFVIGPDGQIEVLIEHHRGGPHCEPQIYFVEFVGNNQDAAFGSTLPQHVINAAPMDIWIMNYPGFGASQGRRRLRSIAPAAQAVFDTLQRQAKGKPIVAYGNSVGSIPALQLAQTRPINAAIFRNIPCVARMILRRYGWWNFWLAALPVAAHVPADFSCRRGGSMAKVPAAFLISERDRVCFVRHQRFAFDAYRAPKRAIVMKGAGHNDPMSASDQNELINWLASVLGPSFPEQAPRHSCPNRFAL